MAEAAAASAPVETPAPPVRRILVVDDDDAIREVAQMALEIVGGFTTATASSGPQAWDLARADVPDAVLLDVMMPGMDGPTLLSHLRSDPVTRDVPIIFLTAKILIAGSQTFDDFDIVGVIAKPFDPMRLPAEISRLLGWTS